MQPFIIVLILVFYTCKFHVHMHLKTIQQWESTFRGEGQVDFKTKLSSPCHPIFSLCPPPPPKYLMFRLNSLLWSVSQEPLMSCHSCRNRVSPQVLHLHQLLPFYWSSLWCLLWLKNISNRMYIRGWYIITPSVKSIHALIATEMINTVTKISSFWIT